MAVLGIDYDTDYNAVTIRFSDSIITFNTGDAVVDFAAAVNYLREINGNIQVSCSSIVHDFVYDIPGYRYDENNMIVADNSKIFETEAEAWTWLENNLVEDYKDNYRFAFVDDYWNIAYYESQEEAGCCGSYDANIKVRGRLVRIGCNYGH